MSRLDGANAKTNGLSRGTEVALTLASLAVLLAVLGFAGVAAMRRSQRHQALLQAAAQTPVTPAALLAYREVGTVATGFKESRAIALDSGGRLYVAGDTGVSIFANGRRTGGFPTGAGAHSLAVTGDGTVYVAFRDHVEVFGANGKRTAIWESRGETAYLTSVAATGNAVYVADAGQRIVYRYDASGKVLARLGEKDAAKGVPGLVVPSPHLDLAVAPGGQLWVVNPGRHRIEAYDNNGNVTESWGKSSLAVDGFGGCCNPTDIALLPDGQFVTSEKGQPRVKVFRRDGVLDCVVAGPEAFNRDAVGLDLAVTSSGEVLVLDPTRDAVRVFARRKDTAR